MIDTYRVSTATATANNADVIYLDTDSEDEDDNEDLTTEREYEEEMDEVEELMYEDIIEVHDNEINSQSQFQWLIN